MPDSNPPPFLRYTRDIRQRGLTTTMPGYCRKYLWTPGTWMCCCCFPTSAEHGRGPAAEHTWYLYQGHCRSRRWAPPAVSLFLQSLPRVESRQCRDNSRRLLPFADAGLPADSLDVSRPYSTTVDVTSSCSRKRCDAWSARCQARSADLSTAGTVNG